MGWFTKISDPKANDAPKTERPAPSTASPLMPWPSPETYVTYLERPDPNPHPPYYTIYKELREGQWVYVLYKWTREQDIAGYPESYTWCTEPHELAYRDATEQNLDFLKLMIEQKQTYVGPELIYSTEPTRQMVTSVAGDTK